MAGNAAYKKGDKFLIDKDHIIPVPQKYQTGPVRFSNTPHNPIVGLEKLDNMKVR
jgi:hypothetical protein